MRQDEHDYALARKLRRNLSLPEGLLWRQLRRKPLGVKFRRQHPVGPYVIDFYCAAIKTGFEVDGFAHDTGDRAERDVRRAIFLEGQGIRLERIPASQVLADVEGVAESIVRYCVVKCGRPLHHRYAAVPLPIPALRKRGGIWKLDWVKFLPVLAQQEWGGGPPAKRVVEG